MPIDKTPKQIYMKHLRFAILIGLIAIVSSSFNSPYSNNSGKERIEVVFNSTLNMQSLIKIQRETAAKGIDLKYNKLEFDEGGKLTAINFSVDCKDGFYGSAGRSFLSKTSRFGFYRDYSKNAVSPFGTGGL